MTATLDETTVLARIMTALDHATPYEYAAVIEIIPSGELTAGEVLQVCEVLDLPAGFLLSSLENDARRLEYLAGVDADGVADLN